MRTALHCTALHCTPRLCLSTTAAIDQSPSAGHHCDTANTPQPPPPPSLPSAACDRPTTTPFAPSACSSNRFDQIRPHSLQQHSSFSRLPPFSRPCNSWRYRSGAKGDTTRAPSRSFPHTPIVWTLSRCQPRYSSLKAKHCLAIG